jgi:hypothetical protein
MVDVPTVLTSISGSGLLAYGIARLESRDRKDALALERARDTEKALALEAAKTPDQRARDLLARIAAERRALSEFHSRILTDKHLSWPYRLAAGTLSKQRDFLIEALRVENSLIYSMMSAPELRRVNEVYGDTTTALKEFMNNYNSEEASQNAMDALLNFEHEIVLARQALDNHQTDN